MRHRVDSTKRLSGKPGSHARSVVRNLLTSLFTHQALVTTEKRARVLVPMAERLITLVKNGTSPMNVIRALGAELYTERSSRVLVEEIAPRYTDRNSGFCRVVALKLRSGDSAKLVRVELI